MKTAKTIKIVFSLTAVSKKLSFALSTGNFGSILKEPIFDCFGGPIKNLTNLETVCFSEAL